MSKLRIHSFAISIDGYGAGPKQNLENPLGVGGLALHEWLLGHSDVWEVVRRRRWHDRNRR
jgi:hypothetical protein